MTLRMVLCFQILILVTAYGGERERFCGEKLTNTLAILCRNRYASHRYNNYNKRSGIHQ